MSPTHQPMQILLAGARYRCEELHARNLTGGLSPQQGSALRRGAVTKQLSRRLIRNMRFTDVGRHCEMQRTYVIRVRSNGDWIRLRFNRLSEELRSLLVREPNFPKIAPTLKRPCRIPATAAGPASRVQLCEAGLPGQLTKRHERWDRHASRSSAYDSFDTRSLNRHRLLICGLSNFHRRR
jgi:hypothetical protein